MEQKNKIIAGFCLLLALCLGSQAAFSADLQPLLQYHDSGQYFREVTAVTRQAKAYLDKRLLGASWQSKKPAIVLDIDETSLSNWNSIRASHFTFPSGWSQDKDKSLAEEGVIPGTYALYREAVKHQVAVFFITGRVESMRATTVKNLHHLGYTRWASLVLKPDALRFASNATFKAHERKKIVDKGYDIVLNMGDQESDLKGGYADKTFKLPNPYYVVH